jgi:hypothetical protein
MVITKGVLVVLMIFMWILATTQFQGLNEEGIREHSSTKGLVHGGRGSQKRYLPLT